MNYIEEKVEEFMNQECPCLWILGLKNGHKKKDCPRYTFSNEENYIRTTLEEVDRRAREERDTYWKERETEAYKTGDSDGYVRCLKYYFPEDSPITKDNLK